MRTFLRVLRVVGIGLVAVLVVAATIVYGVSSRRLGAQVAFEPRSFTAPTADSATLARGQHLATAIGKCAECHGDNMAGKTFIEAGPVFKLYGSNLTRGRGGVGGELTDQQWANAIRDGVRRDGRSLLFMPSEDWNAMSDADLGALVAYLKSLPAVDNVVPASTVGPVGRALMIAGQLPVRTVDKVVEARSHLSPAAPPGPTREYGAYLADIGGCTGCHGPGLSGGRIPGAPPDLPIPSNITPAGIGTWTEAQLASALRTGLRPDGSKIDEFMPIRFTKLMTDQEMTALYAYLRSVPAKEFGGR